MATYAEIRSRVARDLQRVGLSTTQTTDVGTWINQTIREDICLEYNWPFMFTEQADSTVAHQSDYTPSNASTRLKEIFWVRFRESTSDEWRELDEISVRELINAYGELTNSESIPSAWAMVDGDTIRLRPIPDASTYYLQFAEALYPADLSADADTNWLTLWKPRLVEIATCRRGALYFGETTRFQMWDAWYQQELAKAIRFDRIAAGRAYATLNQSFAAGAPSTSTRRVSPAALRTPYDWV